MSIKEINSRFSECQLDYIKEYLLHKESELEDIPDCCVGSKATVCETGNVYRLTSKGWKLETEAAEEGGNTGGSTALGGADWNAAEGEPGHVLNRTHWVDVTEGDILPETTVAINESGNGALAEPILALQIGEEYTVTWNGAEYKCVAATYDTGDMVVTGVGNLAIMGGDDTGEPFAIAAIPADAVVNMGAAIVIITTDGSSSATVSISGKTETVHPLDSKYFGDSLRAQKNIVLDLETGVCNLPFESVAAMEPAEIQASLRLVGEADMDGISHEFSCAWVNKCFAEIDGQQICAGIEFFLGVGENETYSGVPGGNKDSGSLYSYVWKDDGSLDKKYVFVVPCAPSERVESLPFIPMLTEYGYAQYTRTDKVLFNGLRLKSQTANSVKEFLVTVDDTGTLTTTDVTNEDF